MACQVNWSKILEGRYPSYKVEVLAYLDSLDVSNSTEISIEYIYEEIKADPNVCDNLKLLYHEAVFGESKPVKTRIKNRVSNFRRALRYCVNFEIHLIELYNYNV